MMNEEWDYKVSGRANGLIRLIILFVISAFFTVLTVDQLKGGQNKSMIVALFFRVAAVSSIYLFVKLLIRYLCFKVYIGKRGFYFKSNLFNGKYYEYTEIKNCREELKTSRASYNSHSSQPSYFYFFTFTDKEGKTVKFQFEKALYEHEFDILKERINISNDK